AVGIGFNRWLRVRFGEKRDRGRVRPERVASPAQSVDLVDRPLEVHRLLDLADVDDFFERNVELGLAGVDDPHVRLGGDENALRGLRRSLEDGAYRPQVTIAGFDCVADIHDPLDYRHEATPTTMERRVF